MGRQLGLPDDRQKALEMNDAGMCVADVAARFKVQNFRD